MHQGMMRSQGGKGGKHAHRQMPPAATKGSQSGKIQGACAYRLTSDDTRPKRRIVAPKALLNPAGFITDREGAYKTSQDLTRIRPARNYLHKREYQGIQTNT